MFITIFICAIIIGFIAKHKIWQIKQNKKLKEMRMFTEFMREQRIKQMQQDNIFFEKLRKCKQNTTNMVEK